MTDSLLPSQPPLPATFRKQLSSRQFKHIIAALREPEVRYFLGGSFLSNIGGWMQSIAQAWLVLQITNSAFYLGLDGFASTLPLSLFSFWGGVIADRVDRRRLLIAMQWAQLSLALILGVLTQLKMVRVWHVILFSFCNGLTQAIAWPVYQATLANIVEPADLSNAIALNSIQFNMARSLGPMLGALGLSLFGTAGCFYANAVSFLAVIAALTQIRNFHRDRRSPDRPGFMQSFKEGLQYMTASRPLFWLLITMSAASILGFPLVTLLPVFARDILKIGASGLGVLVGSFGVGAVLGGMMVALVGNFAQKGKFVLQSLFLYVGGMVFFAISRNILVSVLCLFITGFSMVSFASVINTIIQGSVPDYLRGRAMSVFVFSFGGCMPLGNLLVGWLAKTYSAPTALVALGFFLLIFTQYVYSAHSDIHSLA